MADAKVAIATSGQLELVRCAIHCTGYHCGMLHGRAVVLEIAPVGLMPLCRWVVVPGCADLVGCTHQHGGVAYHGVAARFLTLPVLGWVGK